MILDTHTLNCLSLSLKNCVASSGGKLSEKGEEWKEQKAKPEVRLTVKEVHQGLKQNDAHAFERHTILI